MGNKFHKELVIADGIHIPFSYQYANASQRTGATGFSVNDIYKIAVQTNDHSVWLLTSVTPTWIQISSVGTVTSVNGQSGVVVLDTDNIDEGAINLYFTQARVSANTDVAANTAARHTHANKPDLDLLVNESQTFFATGGKTLSISNYSASAVRSSSSLSINGGAYLANLDGIFTNLAPFMIYDDITITGVSVSLSALPANLNDWSLRVVYPPTSAVIHTINITRATRFSSTTLNLDVTRSTYPEFALEAYFNGAYTLSNPSVELIYKLRKV